MKYKFLSLILLLASTSASAQHREGYVKVSYGDSIHYVIDGPDDAVPVVLLHGHTLDRRMWDPQVPTLLEAGYRVIRPEMRGYGLSSKHTAGRQFTHQDDMLTVLDSLHLPQVHIVGLSMGSFVASEMVAMHPERMLSAMLASGSIRNMDGPSTPISKEEIQKKEEEIAKNKQLGFDQWKADWIENLVGGGGSKRENIRASVTEQVEAWDGFQLFNPEMRLYYARESWKFLEEKRPDLPVLIVSGENENKSRNKMLDYLSNGHQLIIQDSGHMSNMEQPEVFNQLLLKHLSNKIY